MLVHAASQVPMFLRSSVGFLAVPGLDSTSRIASLLSIVFTLGSVVTGVYLVWSHNNTNAEYHVCVHI